MGGEPLEGRLAGEDTFVDGFDVGEDEFAGVFLEIFEDFGEDFGVEGIVEEDVERAIGEAEVDGILADDFEVVGFDALKIFLCDFEKARRKIDADAARESGTMREKHGAAFAAS